MCSLSALDTQTPPVLSPEIFSQHISLEPIWGRLYSRYATLDSYDLSSPEFTLGRAKCCSCIIKRDSLPENRLTSISKEHFIISRDEKEIVKITDCSRNGTFVNGELVGNGCSIILQNDDEIAIGLKELIVFTYKTIQKDSDTYLPNQLRRKYEVSKDIGRGACGEVKLIFDKYTKEAKAVKKIIKAHSNKNLLNDPDKIQNEVEILRKMDHPFIISMKEIVETNAAVFIVLEYLSGGELTPYIQEGLTETQCKFLFYQMVIALEYLHNQGVIHRDLKPENILLKDPHPGSIIKITDFGLSKIINGHARVQTICGTLTYVAPEVLDTNRSDYGQPVDVWSLGIILYYMLSKDLPFSGADKNQLIKKILCNKLNFSSKWVHKSNNAKDLLRKMLNKNPDERITIAGIINHPWIAKDTQVRDDVHECYSNASKTLVVDDSYDSDWDVLPKRVRFDD